MSEVIGTLSCCNAPIVQHPGWIEKVHAKGCAGGRGSVFWTQHRDYRDQSRERDYATRKARGDFG